MARMRKIGLLVCIICMCSTVAFGNSGSYVKNVVIDADKMWSMTDIYVTQGQTINFLTMSTTEELYYGWKSDRWTGDADGSGSYDSHAIAPNSPLYSLVGRIGDWIFTIGETNSKSFTAQESGYLYLSMNDLPSSFYDNAGSYLVQITHYTDDYNYNDNDYESEHELHEKAHAIANRSNPITQQAVRTFKRAVFPQRIVPLAAQEAEESSSGDDDSGPNTRLLKRHEASADLEYETFTINKNDGDNFTVRAGFSRSNGDYTANYGFNMYFNNLSFDNLDDSFNNNYFSIFYKRNIHQTDTSTITGGITADYMGLDKDYSDDSGFGMGLLISGMNVVGTSQVSWGSMYQHTTIGDLTESMINFGAMWGLPIASRMALTIDCYGVYSFNVEYDGREIELDDPMMLNTGLYFDIYMSSVFAINFGVKKVFLVEDYDSDEFVIGTNYRF